MPKIHLLLSVLLFVLPGCAELQRGTGSAWSLQWPFTVSGSGGGNENRSVGASARGASPAYADFNFDWQLSGDRQIMPMQVFDDGTSMWLQFLPEGVWPAVFDVTQSGWRPLPYRSEGHYMVLDAVYERLALRGGHLHGEIRRTARPERVGSNAQATINTQATQADTLQESVSLPGRSPASASVSSSASTPASAATTESASMPVPQRGAKVPLIVAADSSRNETSARTIVPGLTNQHGAGAEPNPVLEPETVLEPEPSGFLGAPLSRFSVSPVDVTMRQALERWARTAGWVFSAEHWDVDVDIPLVGDANFAADFKSAVRDLLMATEMGDRPLQPCFYSNRVLRVVAYAQSCDRRDRMGVAS